MPFDKLDIKAREAAEQYSAEYNEEAWNKMEALLDKHMPRNVAMHETKERKFNEKWLFLLLSLMAICFMVLLIKPWKINTKNNLPVESIESVKPSEGNAGNKEIAIKPGEKQGTHLKPGTINSTSLNSVSPLNNIDLKSNAKGGQGNNSKNANGNNLKNANVGSNVMALGTSTDRNYIDKSVDAQTDESNVTQSQSSFFSEGFINQKIENKNIEERNMISNNIFIPHHNFKIDKSTNATTKKTLSTKKNKFANSLSLSFSAGPDVSAININNIGSFEILYGAGIGYKFAKNWQVRTGVYTVKKVYEAKLSDYNPPSDFWNYYPDLEEISANCKVIEIPLIINYTLKQNPKHAWFASAGISSYFMKRETYDYLSKTPTGPAYKSYTIYNENKHYLSALRISAGYERTINNTISLTAEPYFNVPLSGIGYGKVRLNSAGLLFSVNVKPFAKK